MILRLRLVSKQPEIWATETNEMNRDTDTTAKVDHLTLAELMCDPVVRLVMKSDGIERDAIESLFARLARRRTRPRRAR